MIDHLVTILQKELKLTAEEIADVFWLTLIQHRGAVEQNSQTTVSDDISQSTVTLSFNTESVSFETPAAPTTYPSSAPNILSLPPAELYLRQSQPDLQHQSETSTSLLFRVPNATALPGSRFLARALRPLQRQVPNPQINCLDEVTTAQSIAETKVWLPVLQPDLELWLDVMLVVDSSPSMLIWQHTVIEFQQLLRQYGIFRDVRTWSLDTDSRGDICLRPGLKPASLRQTPRNPQELLDPSGRRLILVVSDCVSEWWQTGLVTKALQIWGKHGSVALVQVLPEWLWDRTMLRQVSTAQLYSFTPGTANRDLLAVRRDYWRRPALTDIKLPVFTLEPNDIYAWSQMLVGKGKIGAPGVIISLKRNLVASFPTDLNSQQRIQRFRIFASPLARRLAGLLAAAPVISLPVIRLIQEAMLCQSQQVHVAEVLLSGLFKPSTPILPDTNPDEVEYEFYDATVRKTLLNETPVTDTVLVLSRLIEERFEYSLDNFIAILREPQEIASVEQERRPFALVAVDVLDLFKNKESMAL